MKRVTVSLDAQTWKLLSLMAKRTRTTMSALIREAIEERFVKRSYYRSRAPKRSLE